MKKLKVAVLAGGSSSEREVSLRSGLAVFQNLDRKKYEVELFDPATDLTKLVEKREEIDVAFLALHGRGGEDGTIQGFLETLRIRYTGSGIRASANAIDKITTKKIYRAAGLPVAPDLVLKKGDKSALDEVAKHVHFPCVIKPAREGSSCGMAICKTRKELEVALPKAWKLDPYVLAEKYIKGREFTVPVLGNQKAEPLPVIEIITKNEFFDYEAKYDAKLTEEICPADVSASLRNRLQDLAVKAHLALGCRGASRTDMLLEEGTNEIYLLETNTLPGLTDTSLLPKSARSAGHTFPVFLDLLIEHALEQDAE